MKLTENRLRALIALAGGLLIAFGLAKAAFKFQLAEDTERWISSGLFFAAAVLFVQLFKLRRDARLGAARPPADKAGRGGPPGPLVR